MVDRRSAGGQVPPADVARDPIAAAGVQLVRWPEDLALREELAALGRPRILLVPAGIRPPELDELEDWIRVPADELDLWSRMRRMAQLYNRGQAPWLDDEVLHHEGRITVLGASEAELLRPLVVGFRELVLREELEAVLFPCGAPSARTIDARIHRLRVRLAETGLTIHTIRGRGFVLDHHDNPSQAGAPARTEENPWPPS